MGTIWSTETGANDSPTDGTMEPGARAAKKRATSEEDETEAKKRKTGEGLEALRQKYKLLEKKRAKARLEEEDISDLQQEKQLIAKIRDLQEEHPAIRGFCDFLNKNHKNGAAVGTVAGFLDPVSLFHWGRVMDSYCRPLTKESQTLVEALTGHLLEHTMLPSAGYTLVNPGGIFKDSNQMGAGEDQDMIDKVSFRHLRLHKRENAIPWTSNTFYDELDKDQKQRMHLQWHRKVVMMKEAARHGEYFYDPPEINAHFHLAYGYRGLFDKKHYPEYRLLEVDEANQDSNLQELGAFAGNNNGSLYQLFGTILKRAWETTQHARRNFILLEDILHAAEALSIKHNFPVETRHTIHLLDGRTMAATLQEIACFDPGFWELVVEPVYEADEDTVTALLDISLLSHDVLVAKAQENIQNHIKMAADFVDNMEVKIVEEKESIGCNGDNWSDEEASEWLVAVEYGQSRWNLTTRTESEQEAYDKLIEKEALSRQERIKPKLESFAANDIPSIQPHSKPTLIGDRLKFMRACYLTVDYFDTCPSRSNIQLVSPSASLFLQQLIEDFGLGVAIQPFPVTHERLPMPALCGVVLGRNGSTMAQLRVEGQGDDNHDETSDQSDSDFLGSDSEEE